MIRNDLAWPRRSVMLRAMLFAMLAVVACTNQLAQREAYLSRFVGQPESAESSSRMRGSGSTSTAVTGAPARRSASSARCELPHITNCGVPFMKSATSSVSMICLIWSCMSVSVTSSPSS